MPADPPANKEERSAPCLSPVTRKPRPSHSLRGQLEKKEIIVSSGEKNLTRKKGVLTGGNSFAKSTDLKKEGKEKVGCPLAGGGGGENSRLGDRRKRGEKAAG